MKTAAYCKTCRHALVCRQPTLSAIVPCYLSGLLSACGPDASFFPRVPLLFLSHLQGGSTWRRRHLSRLSFVCLFVGFSHNAAARRGISLIRHWLVHHHRCTRGFFPLHDFFYRLACILTDLVSPKISLSDVLSSHQMTFKTSTNKQKIEVHLPLSSPPPPHQFYGQKFSPRRGVDWRRGLFLLSSPSLLWMCPSGSGRS